MSDTYTFLNVGFGDTFVLRLGSKIVMIDCWKEKGFGENPAHAVPSNCIDALILTHQHYDHYYGIEELLKNDIQVKRVFENPWVRKPGDTACTLPERSWAKSQSLVRQLVARGARHQIVAQSTEPFLNLEGYRFRALNPPATINEQTPCTLHDGCLVVLLTTKTHQKEILFCADATIWVLGRIAKLEEISNTRILCCSHHGALDSVHEGLLQKVNPDYTIVSSKPDVYPPIPEPEALAMYERYTRKTVKKTWIDGTITLERT